MKKKYLILGLAMFLLLGVSKVKAETTQTYTSYKAGNRVTVQVNETKKFDFYVIEDSGSESSKITAILCDTSFPILYTYQGATNVMASYGAEWRNTMEVRFPTMKELLGIDVTDQTESGNFTGPSYVKVGVYWLADATQTSEGEPAHWTINTIFSSYGIRYDNIVTEIRPVITVSKEHVDDGIPVKGDKPGQNNSQTSNGGYTQTVITNVPNTLSNHPYIMIGVASLFVLAGIGFVSHNLNQKKRNQ